MKKNLKEFKTFPTSTIQEIQRAANEGNLSNKRIRC